jgi:hypothetical protein
LRLAAAIAGAILGAALCGCTAGSPPATTSNACADSNERVPAGGTAGFNALVHPDFTTVLRATGRARLYEHAGAIAAAIADSPPSRPYAILNAIENVFNRTGPGEAELGYVGANYFTLPAEKYPQYYRYQYVVSGLRPNDANVDVPDRPPWAIVLDKRTERLWMDWVRAGRSVGIASMAPIVAPNAAWKPHSRLFPPSQRAYYEFGSSFYALSRFEALYGKAIAFDSPPHFFLTGGSGAGYQALIEQAIRWGNAHGIRTTMLVSPYPNRRDFSSDTKTFVEVLVAHHAVPSEWAVDDYENTNANDAKAMGPETIANTTTNVALWLAQHAPVYRCVMER